MLLSGNKIKRRCLNDIFATLMCGWHDCHYEIHTYYVLDNLRISVILLANAISRSPTNGIVRPRPIFQTPDITSQSYPDVWLFHLKPITDMHHDKLKHISCICHT